MEEALIEFVKNNPLLYNKKNRFYKSSFKRDEKFEEISTQLNVPVRKLKERWRTLRDKFHKELKSEYPTGTANTPKKKWKWMDSMMFLKDEYRGKDSTVPKRSEIKSSPKEEIIFDSGASTSSLQETLPLNSASSLLLCLKEVFTQSYANPKTQAQLFFECLAKQIDDAKLSSTEFLNLQMEILQTLNKVLYEKN